MIETVTDLLQEFKIKETSLLKKYKILKHPGLIGNMYEGLTQKILSKSLFKNLKLKVSSGKIKNSKGEFSSEIDCMLVIGDGEQIPYSDKFIYEYKDVIAVIEVKKNLYSKDLKSSYQNLRSVINVAEIEDPKPYHGRILKDAYQLICNDKLPTTNELKNKPLNIQHLYHCLSLDAYHPIRIVWGYEGFNSEYNLREKFLDYIGQNISISSKNLVKGFGPVNLPNLIICDNHCLIKTNGMPFGRPISGDDWWSLYVSTNKTPVYNFLEILWSRLEYMYNMSSDIFGEDLIIDAMHPLLFARLKGNTKIKGWEYFAPPISKTDLDIPMKNLDWEPEFIDLAQFVIINELCRNEVVKLENNQELEDFVFKNNYKSIDTFLNGLLQTKLIYIENKEIRLLTEKCKCGISPKGGYFAGEDKSGRVSRWLIKQMKNRTPFT